MRLMIPIDLLLEIRSLMNLLIRGKKLDRDNLKAFVAILGLDWAVEDIQAFMQEKDRTCTSFIDQLAIKIRLGAPSRARAHNARADAFPRAGAAGSRPSSLTPRPAPALPRPAGNEPGNRTLRVRNWWPGRWYICREEENGEEQLFLLLENPEVEGGWQEAGKVLTAGNFTSQPFIIGFRVSGNNRFNVLISKMDPRRNDYLRLEAEEMARRTDPFGRAPGVLSPDLIVEIVKRFHHYADLTALGRKELVRRVVEIAIGDAETFQIDAIMVVLKLLGNHAEPQHVTYLLQSTSVEKPDTTALYVREVEPMLLGMDMMLTVPLDLLKRMRTAWARVDMIDAEGTGALNAQQLKHMSNIMGLARKPGGRRARPRPRPRPHSAARRWSRRPDTAGSIQQHPPCRPVWRRAGLEEQGDRRGAPDAARQGRRQDALPPGGCVARRPHPPPPAPPGAPTPPPLAPG